MMSAEHAKMVALLEASMKEEQRSVIRFLVSKGNKPIKIHRHMKLQYGKECSRCKNGAGSLKMECLVSWMPLDWAKPTES
jgi:hypothetical protein